MLCSVCASIFRKDLHSDNLSGLPRWRARSENLRPLSEIRLSAGRSKCYICILVLKQWEKKCFDLDENGENLQLTYHLQVPEKVSESQLFIGLYLEGNSVGSVALWLVDVQAENSTQPYSPIGADTGSPETLKFLKDRVEECDERHPRCRNARKDAKWYPTRLIDVGVAGDTLGKDAAKLTVTAETVPAGSYASLSHCWGASRIKTLERGSLESMKEEILVNELPKTFRDTIVVCRALNIRYVWIDSLCIIQDSYDDWQYEAQKMFDVYSNAYVTIAATSASNGQMGLFRERDSQAVGSEPLHFEEAILKGQWRLLDRNQWPESIDEAVLNTRAWVVQERLLSSRIIHFGSDQVFWDCGSLAACELHPHGVLNWSTSYSGGVINSQEASALMRNLRSDEQLLKYWGRVVEMYSASHLTFQKDKIIALSGMVEHMQHILQDEFCAGLWRRRIEMQLAWYSDQDSSGRRRSDPLRAPTWSWLSMSTPVKYTDIDGYRGYDIIERAAVTEVELDNVADEELGEVTRGYLRMRCILNPVKLCTDNGRFQFLEAGLGNLQSFVSLDIAAKAEENEILYFIPLFDCQYVTSVNPPRKASETRGILLRRVMNFPGTYERIGHAHVFSNRGQSSDEDFSANYVSIATTKGKEMLPCEQFDASLGHLIKLV